MTPLKVSPHHRFHFRQLTSWTAAMAVASGVYSACGPSDSGGSGIDYGNQAGGGAGTPGAGGGPVGSGGSSGMGISGIGGSISVDAGRPTDGSAETNCGATSIEATKVTKEEIITEEITERAPADVVIIFDQSQSMNEMEGAVSRWQAVTEATSAFVRSPDSAGLGVGIQFFGRNIGLEDCNPASYSQPEVPIALLPANATAIVNAMGAHRPVSETPTTSALTGAINYARQWKNQNPSHPVFVLLVTDGEPGVIASMWTTCLGNVQDMPATVAAAQAGFSGTPSIPTFVLGVGPNLPNLDQIAVAGGTQKAHVISGGNVSQQVVTALNTIRGTISKTVTRTVTKTQTIPLDCEWVMPAPTGTAEQDPDKVNVNFSAGGIPNQLGKVPSQADCASYENGWYYDDPVNPTKIIACPSTCDSIKAASDAKIDILVGCDTYIAPPL